MEEYQLEDMLPSYYPQTQQGIQTETSAKKEFSMLEAGRSETLGRQKLLFNHQELFVRFMIVYPVCLYMAAAGTGKSMSYIALREKLASGPYGISKSYFITGNQQKDDIKRQIAYSPITRGKYLTDTLRIEDPKRSEAKTKMIISKSVKRWHHITSYVVLWLNVKQDILGLSVSEANKVISSRFSGSLLFLDEIQFIRMNGRLKANRERVHVYRMVWRILQLAVRCKKVISSATPFINSPEDLVYVINLINPASNQIRTDLMETVVSYKETGIKVKWADSDIEWDSDRVEGDKVDYYVSKLSPFLRGKVIYVATADTGIEPTYYYEQQPVTPPKNGSARHVFMESLRRRGKEPRGYSVEDRFRSLPMRGLQLTTYVENVTENLGARQTEGKRADPFYGAALSIATFVFPKANVAGVPNYGISAYHHWIDYNQKTDEFRIRESAEKGLSEEKTLTYMLRYSLDQLSVKMWYVVQEALSYAGKWYIFTPVLRDAGAHILGLALEMGVLWDDDYRETLPTEPFQRYRGTKNNIIGDRIVGLNKTRRYAILSSDNSDAEIHNVLAFYNHKDNNDGEYLKILIMSPIGQVGLNLMETSRVVSLRPEFNWNDFYQSLMRAIRVTSHVTSVAKARERDPNARVIVQIDMLVATMGKKDTIDSKLYVRADIINRKFAPIVRAMKKISVAAHILSRRNDLDEKLRGYPECDYGDCHIEPAEPRPSKIDSSTYDLFYSGKSVKETMEQVVTYFSRKSFATIETLSEKLSQEPKHLYTALSKIIYERVRVIDRFGYQCYMRELSSNFYLVRSSSRIAVTKDYMSLYYNTNVIGSVRGSLFDAFVEREQTLTEARLLELLNKENDDDVIEFMFGLNKVQKALVVELLVTLFETRDEFVGNKRAERLISYFVGTERRPGQLLWIREPKKELNIYASQVGVKSERQLSKPVYYDIRYMEHVMKEAEEAEGASSYVYVHGIYASVPLKHKVGAGIKASNVTGRIRIFSPVTGQWRDTVSYESPLYRMYLQMRVGEAENAVARNNTIYGKFLSDGFFRIVDRRTETVGRKNTKTGRIDSALTDVEMVEALWTVGHRIAKYEVGFPPEDTVRKELLDVVKRVTKRETIMGPGTEGSPPYYWIVPSSPSNPWKIPAEMAKYMYYMLGIGRSRGSRRDLSIELMTYLVSEGIYVDMHGDAYQQYLRILRTKEREEVWLPSQRRTQALQNLKKF